MRDQALLSAFEHPISRNLPTTFPSIRIEGQIFSGELLERLDQPDLPGQRPADFGLPPDRKVKDEIATAWASGQSYYRAFKAKIGRTR